MKWIAWLALAFALSGCSTLPCMRLEMSLNNGPDFRLGFVMSPSNGVAVVK